MTTYYRKNEAKKMDEDTERVAKLKHEEIAIHFKTEMLEKTRN